MSRQIGVGRPGHPGRSLARTGRVLLIGLAALALAASPLVTAGVGAAGRVAPKVVLIVGPAGDATPSYRRLADEAAAAAAQATPNVVEVYSPDATWANVKAALQGASIVVYLGHGNGWPSIYRDALYPPTQNGFGLNPNAGAADSHQYFGEEQIGREVRLAPNAVVILSHLCYASGNTEPGLAEGTLAEAQQRVDNYAAGFFRAGARAVIADAYLDPAYYVRAILRGTGSIDDIWTRAPDRNDHFLRFASQRTKGAIAQMDPDEIDSGFHRSIVLKASLTSAEVLGGAVRDPGVAVPVFEPSLISLGVTFGAPTLAAPPTAGSRTTLVLPVARDAAALLPVEVLLGTRWDRLDGATAGAAGGGSTAAPGPAGSAAPTAAPSPSSSPGPDASGLGLVVPEQVGELVAPVRAKRVAPGGISVAVTVPSTPGLYRLVATIHQPDGVAYDAATQALLPALVVRVTGPVTAAYRAPSTTTVGAGDRFALAVHVTNLGGRPWGSPARSNGYGAAELEPARRATLVARWVDLGGLDPTPGTESGADATVLLPAGLAPGAGSDAMFNLTAPATAGEYLLVLDAVDPATGSLAAAGVPPGIVRVTVTG